MSPELQAIAAIAIVTITVIVTGMRYMLKRRNLRKGTACAGGCGCTKSARPHITPRS